MFIIKFLITTYPSDFKVQIQEAMIYYQRKRSPYFQVNMRLLFFNPVQVLYIK